MNLNRFRITLLFGTVALGLSACASLDSGTAKDAAKPTPPTTSPAASGTPPGAPVAA